MQTKQEWCYTCGSGLVVKSRMMGYDTDSGHPVFRLFPICPKRKWYQIFHLLEPLEYLDIV